MTKREIVSTALAGQEVPYVPWCFSFTIEAREKLVQHYGSEMALDQAIDNHMVFLGNPCGSFKDIGNDCVKDYFGVVWDRSVDKDIGMVKGEVLPQPTLDGYEFPDPYGKELFGGIEEQIEKNKDSFLVHPIGFSLYERAWTLRGMETLMFDFIENPDFMRELLRAIADFNIAQLNKAVTYDIDGIYFGDDWGQQQGLQMGPQLWREFIYPELKRMYGAVKAAGKKVFIHSCGDVDELFDDLIEIGLDCFNPFQPEVMDVKSLMVKYRGRLSFHGGISTQQTLPYGTVDDVRKEVKGLLELGKSGNYILAPAHAVEGDVPLENMLAFINEAKSQPGYRNH